LELNHTSSTTLKQEKIFAEINDRQSRSCNVINIFNVTETQSTADDELSTSNIFRQIYVVVDPISVLRLGKLSNKNRRFFFL